ncbi:MAG: glycosyltransferase family 2 protein [Hyphomicrobiaceae bacterium]
MTEAHDWNALARLHWAVHGLSSASPAFSARSRPAVWQIVAPSFFVGAFAGLSIGLSETAHLLLAALLAAPFLCVVVLRLLAVREVLARPPVMTTATVAVPNPGTPLTPDPLLPVYSILVPLVDEVEVLPRLIKALGALDYPSDRLDIILALEEADPATQRAVAAIRLPPHFRTLVVPQCEPRTKPKALNYALTYARGDFVVIYDAEDRPEPDQLRKAVAAFNLAGPRFACLQAALNIDVAAAGLLSRQFTIEYSALFDALLPALERLDLPLPLGGTSNHFRTAVLREVGAWDPFNVTEDADLGIRFARLGWTVGTLPSTTWEQAPPDFGNWWRQRTRWLKGWLLTYLVHTRFPRRLAQDLGGRRHLGFHVLMGSMLLSVLAYPVGVLLLAIALADGRLLATPETDLEWWLWWATALNLFLGVGTAILLGALAVWRRGRAWLMPWTLLMPVYWLLISAAGYRALWKLVREPYVWEKTQHGDGEA